MLFLELLLLDVSCTTCSIVVGGLSLVKCVGDMANTAKKALEHFCQVCFFVSSHFREVVCMDRQNHRESFAIISVVARKWIKMAKKAVCVCVCLNKVFRGQTLSYLLYTPLWADGQTFGQFKRVYKFNNGFHLGTCCWLLSFEHITRRHGYSWGWQFCALAKKISESVNWFCVKRHLVLLFGGKS